MRMPLEKKIIIITDYKVFFGSKLFSPIYRGGMDIQKMESYLNAEGYKTKVIEFTKTNSLYSLTAKPIILYTSSEDKDGKYKSFIEDIIFDLEKRGFQVIPSIECLRAHNNKVAMELMRDRSLLSDIQTIHSRVFGTLEELRASINEFSYPVVIKTFSGAMSRGVDKADNPIELLKKAANLSKSPNLRHDIKELLRKLKYRQRYVKESFHRSKFVVQNLIEGLKNDWKVLVYGNRCYVLRRDNRDNDFRASGSGKFTFSKELPEGMLDFALKVCKHFNVPHISLDIAYDGTRFHLIEFQFLYFGTTTIEKSNHYFLKSNNGWEVIEEQSDLEQVYVDSVLKYLNHL